MKCIVPLVFGMAYMMEERKKKIKRNPKKLNKAGKVNEYRDKQNKAEKNQKETA